MNMFSEYRDKCPACGSAKFTELYNLPYSSEIIKNYLHEFYSNQGHYDYSKVQNLTFILAECDVCSCVFQVEIPNDLLMKELYEMWLDPDKTFQIFEKDYPLDYYVSYMKKIYRVLRMINKKPKQIDVLDFGMGWGNWLQIIKAFGCNAYGCELSEQRIAYAKKNGIENLDYNVITNYKFDFINTDQVFEHVPDPQSILQILVQSLKEDGYIRISVPDGKNIRDLLNIMDWNAAKGSPDSLNVVAPLEHINYFRTSSILKMADNAGLEPICLPYYPRLDEINSPMGKMNKFLVVKNTMGSLFKDLLRPVYSKLFNRSESKINFWSTDLLFKIKG